MGWPADNLGPPNFDLTVDLGNVADTVITPLPTWLLGWRFVNNTGVTAKIYLTNAAGKSRFNGYELAPGGVLTEALNAKPELGMNAWSDQPTGVSFNPWGWS